VLTDERSPEAYTAVRIGKFNKRPWIGDFGIQLRVLHIYPVISFNQLAKHQLVFSSEQGIQLDTPPYRSVIQLYLGIFTKEAADNLPRFVNFLDCIMAPVVIFPVNAPQDAGV
jgi:hypothetical protein